ncbi:MAG: TetR/AcrR family transcriptional regulator [Hyphomonadaceae bacterium]|nr:TetR/AcrR family transcriptional regulator [Hyphomonadaceae bacterium]
MTRIVKLPEERRNELLDCAQRLFFTKGYDKTTVDDVLKEAGVSKGAFYHYFASKEAMLEAWVARYASHRLHELEEDLRDTSLDAPTRLNRFFQETRSRRKDVALMMRAMSEVIFQPENEVLYHRINTATMATITPLLTEIIEQGVREGVFSTPDARGTAELILQLVTGIHKVVAAAIEERKRGSEKSAARLLERRLRLYETAITSALDLRGDAMRLADSWLVQALTGASPGALKSTRSKRAPRARETVLGQRSRG